MAQVQGLSQNSPCLLQHQGPFSSPVFCLTACLCCSLTLWHPPRSVFSGCSTAESPPPDQLFEALWYVTSVCVLWGLKLKWWQALSKQSGTGCSSAPGSYFQAKMWDQGSLFLHIVFSKEAINSDCACAWVYLCVLTSPNLKSRPLIYIKNKACEGQAKHSWNFSG